MWLTRRAAAYRGWRGLIRQRADTGKWEIRWRGNGRHRSRSFTRKSDAERFETRVRSARELGEVLDLDRGKETVAEFIERWWREYAVVRLEENTRKSYAQVWEKHLRRRIGGYRLRDVSPAVVYGIKAELFAEKVGAPTVRKALALLSGILRCAVEWDRIDRNPVRDVGMPVATRSRHVRPLPPATVETMRARLLLAGAERDAAILSVLAYSGLRPEEVRALRWSDVHERTLLVERAAAGSSIKATKTREIRSVRLLEPLAEDLSRWREASPSESELVFPTQRGTVWTDYDWRNWRKRVFRPASEAVELPKARPYDLRHSFASLLIQEGVSVVEVARQLGNSTTVTLDTYAHVFEELDPTERMPAVNAIRTARRKVDVRGGYADGQGDEVRAAAEPASTLEADARTRTGDPFITSEVLYQLSYVGSRPTVAGRESKPRSRRATKARRRSRRSCNPPRTRGTYR
jgi:integrase